MSRGNGGLAEVLALLAKATPGEFTAKYGVNLMAGDGFSATNLQHDAQTHLRNESNAAALVAAVNYLRSHGEAIAELIEADKEYDAALGLVRQTEATYGKRSAAAGRARAALDLANERRAAALSNIEGASQ